MPSFPFDGPPRYSKELGGERLEYVGSAEGLQHDAPVEVQISLDDSGLEDAFRVTLPPHFSRLTVGDLLNEVFSDDEAQQDDVLASMDLAANPDLPEIYEDLLDIFGQWRVGDCTLRFFANHGPEVDLFHPISDHLSLSRVDAHAEAKPLLDLVLERRYEVLARFEEDGGDVDALLEWLRELIVLYFIDKHGFRLSATPEDDHDRQLLPIAEGLRSRGLIQVAEDSQQYEITSEGNELLGEVISETEGYIDNYGVFDDVLYDFEAGTVEFGTGLGEDLRVQVYQNEGVDSIRAVFLLRLYDSTLDSYSDTWRELIHSVGFIDEVLRPVLDHAQVDDEVADWIIEAGFAHKEEEAEEARESASQREALDRLPTSRPDAP